ncbi:MAG TPA: hypothetical protein VFW81_06270, partial [Thermoanaerobaculia bacterium]|nr:hypothetical protein [Thermoanaerobaculia bacterium]
MSLFLGAVLIAAMAAPSQSRASSDKPVPQPIPSAAAPARSMSSSAPPGPGHVVWAMSADEAQDRASREGKFVFFEFTAAECGNCKRMDSLLYPAFD